MRNTVALLLFSLSGGGFACAQNDNSSPNSTPAPPQPLSFSGTGLAETTVFTTRDRWQVHWEDVPASISVEDANGNVLAGAGGAGGTLYMPTGGSYKLRVSPNDPNRKQWRVEIDQVAAVGQTLPPGNLSSLYVPPDMTASPQNGADSTTAGGSSAAPNSPASNPGPPGQYSSTMNAKLTPAQAAAVVLIRGDNAEGTGFLVKTAAGPFVVTNQHVISANPHVQLTTTSGDVITTTGLTGAADRDLAMIPIKDNNYSYLQLATDVPGTVQVGDVVVTPGNSQGGDVMLNTNGTVLALGPQKVEISNPIYHGNSGGPIIHIKSGKVIGVVTEGMKVDASDSLDQASFQNRNSAIQGTMRYFGLRIDNVATWENFTWQRFENETEFLNEFHERSKCLDSYLNTGANDMSEWGTYYSRDEKIKETNEAIASMAAGGDGGTIVDTERNLVFSLAGLADADMDQIQQPSNFYSYDQTRARDEIAYRKWLKSEIDQMGDNVERVGSLARRSN